MSGQLNVKTVDPTTSGEAHAIKQIAECFEWVGRRLKVPPTDPFILREDLRECLARLTQHGIVCPALEERALANEESVLEADVEFWGRLQIACQERNWLLLGTTERR